MSQHLLKKRSQKTGLAPGAMVYVGKEAFAKSALTLIHYNEDELHIKTVESIEDLVSKAHCVNWLNVDGVSDTAVVRNIGEKFSIHQLILEDIVNTEQRPKVDFLEDCVFISINMLNFNEAEARVEVEHVSLVLKADWVFSFQEKAGDVFAPVRDRIKHKKGKVRLRKADYLIYSLLDAVVDQYFLLLEKLDEKIAAAEDRVVHEQHRSMLTEIHQLRRELIVLKKSVQPTQELLRTLLDEHSPLLKKDTEKYLNDVYDHSKYVHETIDVYRDVLAHLFEMYMSGLNHKMNHAMKVLAVMTTIFIPLTFVAGIYGMNFAWMPELQWKWGYPTVLGAMFIIFIGSLIYFKKKDWF